VLAIVEFPPLDEARDESASPRERIVRIAAGTLLGLCTIGLLSAQEISTSLYSEMQWPDDRAISRREGERRGGRAGKSRGLLFCGGWWGVWKTTDGGTVRKRFSTRAGRFDWCAGAGAFECEHHLRWNGCEYDICRQQLWRWNYKSLDGGKTATPRTGGHATYRKNPVDPHNPDIVLVAAMGHSSGRTRARSFPVDGRRAELKKVLTRQSYRSGGSLF